MAKRKLSTMDTAFHLLFCWRGEFRSTRRFGCLGVKTTQRCRGEALAAPSSGVRPKSIPTIVHITHAKAGSTWLDRVWRELLGSHVAPRGKGVAANVGGDLARHTFAPGRFYSAMFMTRADFMQHPELHEARRLVVIRDLRDTLVSLYFSWKVSHGVKDKIVAERERLRAMTVEDGLMYLVNQRLNRIAEIQTSWIESGSPIVRYEDLLLRDVEILTGFLREDCKLALPPNFIRKVAIRNRFQARFKRPLGTEKIASHARQGASGNWRRHFTPRVAEAFAKRFGGVLSVTGYETDDAWVADASFLQPTTCGLAQPHCPTSTGQRQSNQRAPSSKSLLKYWQGPRGSNLGWMARRERRGRSILVWLQPRRRRRTHS